MSNKASFDEQWDELMVWYRTQAVERPRQFLSLLEWSAKHKVKRWVLELINYWGDETMARGKTTAAPTPAKNGGAWTNFVDIPLGSTTIEDVRVEFPTIAEVDEALNEALMNGYRMSLSYNPQNDAVIATFTCKDEASVNVGCTLTAFAGTWGDALSVLLYKHVVIAKKNWVKASSGENKPKLG